LKLSASPWPATATATVTGLVLVELKVGAVTAPATALSELSGGAWLIAALFAQAE
jgi:hypothetical protein